MKVYKVWESNYKKTKTQKSQQVLSWGSSNLSWIIQFSSLTESSTNNYLELACVQNRRFSMPMYSWQETLI